jgi:hypothetical protein
MGGGIATANVSGLAAVHHHPARAGKRKAHVRIGSIVIRCYEFKKMLAFWQDALHYVPK